MQATLNDVLRWLPDFTQEQLDQIANIREGKRVVTDFRLLRDCDVARMMSDANRGKPVSRSTVERLKKSGAVELFYTYSGRTKIKAASFEEFFRNGGFVGKFAKKAKEKEKKA